jgi:hypothetical protein
MKASLFLALSILALISHFICAETIQPEFNDRFYGGQSNIEFIRNAESVKAIRLSLPKHPRFPDRPDLSKGRDIANYIRSAESIVPQEVASKIKDIIFDEKIDEPNSSKSCSPNFGVQLLFTTKDRSIAVNFCFHCDIIWISENNKVIGGGDFDPVHNELVDLIKKVLPNDPAIRQLK